MALKGSKADKCMRALRKSGNTESMARSILKAAEKQSSKVKIDKEGKDDERGLGYIS